MRSRLAVLAVLATLAWLSAATPAMAADAKGELTFSASLFNPDAGATIWSGTGEYLIPVGKYLVAGPSLSLFDAGEADGGAAGGALEVNLSKGPGLFFGGAAHKLTGDAADAADYTYEARAGFKLGGERGGAKIYASQTWAKQESGATVDPGGTAVNAGLYLRF